MKKNTLLYLCLILTLYLLPNKIYALGTINNEKIKEIVQNNQGQSALVTKQSGEIVAGYNNNVNPNYGGASTVKLIVADIIISRFNQGTIKLDDTISIPSCVRPGEELNKGSWVVRDAMRNMLKDSGNSSTNALIYSVTKSCDAKGINNLLGNYSNTKINSYLNLPGASPVLGSAGGNTTNANDVSKAMSRIFTSSGEAANIAKTSLQSSTDKLGINSIANKVGITSRVTGNVAIVEIGGNNYIVTVFVDGNNEAKVTAISNEIIKILNENKDSLAQSDSTSPTDSTTSTGASTFTSGAPVSYESYTNFPGVGRISNLCQLITALWYLGFAVLLTSVLGMFLWGGYIYVTAGVNAGKVNQAKEIFTNTITGLIIGLSIFIIINIINPGLLQGNCSIPSVGSGATVGGPAGPSNIIPKPGESVFPVTREYQCPGPRTSFGYARGRLHAGVDLTPPLSTISDSQALQLPILAFRDGTVNEVGGGFGVVGIDHGGGLETRYLHNSKILVSNGQKVTAGQEIAKMGDAGSPGVIHAHFEVYQNNRPVDPAPIIFDSGKNPDPSKVKTTGSPKCVGQNS